MLRYAEHPQHPQNAGDDEAVCELPWPCSSVVPEQKNFGWIKGSGAPGARGCLPSVATHRNMTVEDVMAWRLSHRFRQRRVEPVLQSMWQEGMFQLKSVEIRNHWAGPKIPPQVDIRALKATIAKDLQMRALQRHFAVSNYIG
eukprot:s225_g40.t1